MFSSAEPDAWLAMIRKGVQIHVRKGGREIRHVLL